MTELEKFIAELQYHADNGVTEIHPYISRDDDNWDANMWVLKPDMKGFENIIELGMEVEAVKVAKTGEPVTNKGDLVLVTTYSDDGILMAESFEYTGSVK